MYSKLEKFILDDSRRKWMHIGTFKVYMRKSIRMRNNKFMKCIDIANIENCDETQRGKGKFWELISKIQSFIFQSNVEFDAIFIESVINPQLVMSLKNRDWNFDDISNFWLELPTPTKIF